MNSLSRLENRFSQALNLNREHTSLQEYIGLSHLALEKYEAEGDFASALKVARDGQSEALLLGLAEEIHYFQESTIRLERTLLKLGSSRLLFDENFQPRIKLLTLLELVNMDPLNSFEKSVVQINRWAQRYLLRQGERWEAQSEVYEDLKPRITPLLSDLGFIEESSAHFEHYSGAIVHGALLSTVRIRLHHLVEQWDQGTRFPHLYFLTGERPLDPQEENDYLFIQDENSPLTIRKDWIQPSELPKTECEMMQMVWDQSEIPESMRQETQVHFINAPMKKAPNSDRMMRPNTDDTVNLWIKSEPLSGRYLAISNAPYTNRQDLVIRGLSPENYVFDTIGPGANPQEKVAIILDELARFIFQMNLLAQKSE